MAIYWSENLWQPHGRWGCPLFTQTQMGSWTCNIEDVLCVDDVMCYETRTEWDYIYIYIHMRYYFYTMEHWTIFWALCLVEPWDNKWCHDVWESSDRGFAAWHGDELVLINSPICWWSNPQLSLLTLTLRWFIGFLLAKFLKNFRLVNIVVDNYIFFALLSMVMFSGAVRLSEGTLFWWAVSKIDS